MFLITPEFAVRIQDIRKIIPFIGSNKEILGTTVHVVNSHDSIDREVTAQPYNEVMSLLAAAMKNS